MRKSKLWFGLLLGAVALAVSSGGTGDAANIAKDGRQLLGTDSVGFSPQEWAVIKALSPLPDLPVDTTNRHRNSPAAALLGQKLFFEPRLSGPIQQAHPRKDNSARSAKRARSRAAIATCRSRSGSSTYDRITAAQFRTRRLWGRPG
jgi:hypothetical protein